MRTDDDDVRGSKTGPALAGLLIVPILIVTSLRFRPTFQIERSLTQPCVEVRVRSRDIEEVIDCALQTSFDGQIELLRRGAKPGSP